MAKAARERILDAALKEFAAKGFSGASVDFIAKKAKINKAMIFYYFSSKKKLYNNILHRALLPLFTEIQSILIPQTTVDSFLENIPKIYISFFSRHSDLIKIMGLDLLQNPENISSALQDIIQSSEFESPKPVVWGMIHRWQKEGLLSELDPVQIMMNIISMSIFPFIALPIIEKIIGENIEKNEEFIMRRMESVVHVLKNGMLK